MNLSKYISRTFIAGLLIALVFSSCRKLLIGNGDIIQQTATLTAFTDVISNGDFDVTVIPSNRFFIKLEGESNILAQTETVIRGGNELSIQYKNNANVGRHRSIKVWLEAPVFKSLNINGSGSFRSNDTLYSNRFNATISGSGKIEVLIITETAGADIFGSGDIILKGRSDITGLRTNGSGSIKAYDLISKTTVARISGSGNIETKSIDFLRAEIFGSGSVFYKGSPQIETVVVGSGGVHHRQ